MKDKNNLEPSDYKTSVSSSLNGLDALEKIDHTVCLAFNENNNALFNKDEYEHIDCKDIDEFVDCYDIIEKELKNYYKLLKNIFPHPKENGEEYRQLAVKRLLALEIIKEHWTYNDIGLVQIKPISMEDADLLKEVLL